MDYLNDMALFVEVAKARGFRRAADAVGMPTSTLSRRIALLEQSVGLRLFTRTTRRIELTEAGLLYFDRCKRIIDEARIAHEELGTMLAQPTGILRVSAPPDLASIWLASVLKDFVARYPGITFDLDLTPRNVDLITEPFDLAIRMANPGPSHLVSRVIGRVTPRLYAAPSYLAAQGEPTDPAQLEQHQCLTMKMVPSWELHSGPVAVSVRVGSRFKANNVAILRQLAVHGLGIVNLPERAVVQDLATGTLTNVLPAWQGAPMSIHAVTETKLLPAKTQRFIEFLKERFQT
jgi:DNA-binding transcriptional LysR family regulator